MKQPEINMTATSSKPYLFGDTRHPQMYDTFLFACYRCELDEEGNRPCDNGFSCDKCKTKESQVAWETFRDNFKGPDTTIADLCKMEMLSIRLYSAILRYLRNRTGQEVDDLVDNVTLRDIRELLLDGRFVRVYNMSSQARMELYDLLIGFCGDNRITWLAITENISRLEFLWYGTGNERPEWLKEIVSQYRIDLDVCFPLNPKD